MVDDYSTAKAKFTGLLQNPLYYEYCISITKDVAKKTSAGSYLNPASCLGQCTFKISLKGLCSVEISAGDKISFRQNINMNGLSNIPVHNMLAVNIAVLRVYDKIRVTS